MIRTVIASLVLAISVAVGEVMVRWHDSPKVVDARQLALAVFANVAVLGSFALVTAVLGSCIARLFSRGLPRPRSGIPAVFPGILFGAIAAGLVLVTRGLGITSIADHGGWLGLCAVLFGAVAGLGMLHAQRTRKQRLSGCVRVSAVVVWALCLAAAAAAFMRTREQVEQWVAHAEATTPAKSGALPHVVLLVVDTLRADGVGVYHPESPTLTPNIDRLAESSIIYTNALSTAPWTLPSHASLFTGLYPDVHGVSWGHYALNGRWPVLAELLKAKGYGTFAISNNWLLNSENGFARGFDTFIETAVDPALKMWRLALQCGILRSLARATELGSEVAEDAGSSWTNWLVRRYLVHRNPSQNPIFLFINYMEPHDPYRPPRRYAQARLTPEQLNTYRHLDHREQYLAAQACEQGGVFTPDQIAALKSLYDVEVAYQDDMIGELLNMLETNDVLEHSWVVVTSDHGELFGEWDMVYHTASSHYNLLHVPLIVRPPGGTQGRRISAPVQPVDIFATLLKETGVETPKSVRRAHCLPMRVEDGSPRALSVAQTPGASLAGLSMTQRMNMQSDLSHWLTWVSSIYADGYLLQLESDGSMALFDVANDPEMKWDQAQAMPDRVQHLASEFAGWQANRVDNESDHETEMRANVLGGRGRAVVSAGCER